MLPVDCPFCQTKYQVREDKAGKAARCKVCRKYFRVNEPRRSPTTTPKPPPPPLPRQRLSARARCIIWAVAVVSGLVALSVFVVVYTRQARQQEEERKERLIREEIDHILSHP